MIRRQMGWADKNTQKAKPVNIAAAAPTEDVGELPASIFTQKLNLRNSKLFYKIKENKSINFFLILVTTISQRHGQPADQPFSVNKLYPQRRFLWIKRSLRCRQCEHNVIKPEYHPTSIRYRIQLFANYHVPDVLLVRCEQPQLFAGKAASVILKLTNPTMHDMKITIMELPTVSEELQMIEEFKRQCAVSKDTVSAGPESLKSITSSPSLTSTLSRQTSLTEDPRIVTQHTNAVVEMLDSSFVLSQRDDSAEFDEDVAVQREEPK